MVGMDLEFRRGAFVSWKSTRHRPDRQDMGCRVFQCSSTMPPPTTPAALGLLSLHACMQ